MFNFSLAGNFYHSISMMQHKFTIIILWNAFLLSQNLVI